MLARPDIPIVWREHALHPVLHRRTLPAGLTIAEIVERTPGLPPWFMAHGEVSYGGLIVPRESWHRVRPKYDPCGRNMLHLHLPLQGGESGGTLRTVAAIAIVAAALFVTAGGAAPFLGAGFAAGAFGATALGAAVSIGGSLALAALTPPPSLDSGGLTGNGKSLGDARDGTASLSGNALAPGGAVPRVIGTHRVYPPLACHPLTELIEDGDEAIERVEAVFVLAGPHQIANVRNGETPVADIDEIESETREGYSSDTALTLVTRQSKTDGSVIELTKHKLKLDDEDALEDQTTPLNSVPDWHSIVSRKSPDEIWLNFAFPQGLIDTAAPTTQKLCVPLRVRMREVGDTAWINLPEIHFTHLGGRPFQRAVKIKHATAGTAPTPRTEKAPYAAFTRVPMRVDRTIGNFNNPENGFDGNPQSTSTTRSTSTGYSGADWSHYPRSASSFELWPHETDGMAPGANTVSTIEIRGKSTAGVPANATDGTLLYTTSPGADQTTPYKGTLNDTTTKWRYLWTNITLSGGTSLQFRQLRFFDDEGFSWKANDHFLAADLNNYVEAANIGSTNVQNIHLNLVDAEVYLPTGTFPKGDYEIQIMRGSVYRKAQFVPARYKDTMANQPSEGVSDGWVVDYFRWGYGTDTLYHVTNTQEGFHHDMNLTRVSRIWNEAVLGEKLAAIAVRGTSRRIENINCDASGYVNTWDGSDWDTVAISSNPADHYRDVLIGDLNASALPEDLIDEANITDWWDHCDTMGYEANMVVEGKSAFEVMNALAGCGYARPRQSETWGVIMDRDRSADDPVQIFSPANMRGFRWEKAFNRLPDGFRVRFKDSTQNYDEQEVIVLRDGVVDTGRYEDMPYDGLVTEAEAQARAEFDLAQLEARSVFYRGEAPLEWLVAQRGDLVGVQYDVITEAAGAARIKQVLTSGSNITGLVLNGTVPRAKAFFIDTGGEDFFTEVGAEDFFIRTMGMAIRGRDGSVLVKAVNPPVADDVDDVEFSAPFANPGTGVIDADCLVVSGELGSEFKRMIVNDISPKKGFTAMLTFVDEAPELHV